VFAISQPAAQREHKGPHGAKLITFPQGTAFFGEHVHHHFTKIALMKKRCSPRTRMLTRMLILRGRLEQRKLILAKNSKNKKRNQKHNRPKNINN
jgi:hypothetical protein